MNEPRETARGSSQLDPESQRTWQERFGQRYVHVQQTPGLPSRAQRRGNTTRRKRGRR